MFTSVLSTALVATTVVAERSSLELDTLSNPEMAPRRRAGYFGRYPLERAAFELGERSVLTRLAREIESVRRARVATTPDLNGQKVCIYMPDFSDPRDRSWASVYTDAKNAIMGLFVGEDVPKYYACSTTTDLSYCPDEGRGLDESGNPVGGESGGRLKLMGKTCAVLNKKPDDCQKVLGTRDDEVVKVRMTPYLPEAPRQVNWKVDDYLRIVGVSAPDEDGDTMQAWADNDVGAGLAGPSELDDYQVSSDYQIMRAALELYSRNDRCNEHQVPEKHPNYDAYIKAGLQPPNKW